MALAVKKHNNKLVELSYTIQHRKVSATAFILIDFCRYIVLEFWRRGPPLQALDLVLLFFEQGLIGVAKFLICLVTTKVSGENST
jgi:hypothetical protein